MISRRVFLKRGSFALVSVGFAPSFLARTALAASAPRRSKQLIAIFQRGAVDGLSVIVPHGEADYYRSRPSIAIPRPGTAEGAAIDLEVWSLPEEKLGAFARQIPAPLGLGSVALADGTSVLGFLCENYAVSAAQDITSFGGWRAYLRSLGV